MLRTANDIFDGFETTSFVHAERHTMHEAIAKNDFGIYRDVRDFSIDRGNFRIAFMPHRLDVDHGCITSIEMAIDLVDLYEKHAAFFFGFFDRCLKLQATGEDFDRFIHTLRSAREEVKAKGL